MMSKKHYNKVAEILAQYPKGGMIQKEYLVERLSQIFSDDNPSFRWAQFEEACGG